jgi:RNA polymerase sigma-54 factor
MDMLQGMALIQQPKLRFVLAPELRQSLHLLQLSMVELHAYIREHEQNNPLLEVEWPQEMSLSSLNRSAFVQDRQTVEHWYRHGRSGESLEQDLLSQLRMTNVSREMKRAAAFLAGSLDEDGYLTLELEEAAHSLSLPVPLVERGLRLLHSFEPAGAAARSLAECLLLQFNRNPTAPRVMERLVQEHLVDVAKGRWKLISRSLGLREEEIAEAVQYMRTLNPKPGLSYVDSPIPYVWPEARLVRVGEQSAAKLLRSWMPTVTLHPLAREISAYGGSSEWRRRMELKRKEASLLIEGLSFRKHTLRSVIYAVAVEQQSFLLHGPAFIRPLKLEQVAARAGFHLSTVSRAIRDKYVETDFGLFPLSRFFTVGLETDGAGEISSRSIKYKIRAMIGNENKSQPLSDSELAEALQGEGIRISRRTVAKYREEERLLPSTLRLR